MFASFESVLLEQLTADSCAQKPAKTYLAVKFKANMNR